MRGTTRDRAEPDQGPAGADGEDGIEGRRLLVQTLAPYHRHLGGAAALTVLATAAALAVPFLVKRGIDHGVVPGDASVLAATAALLVAVAAAGALVHWGAELLAGQVAEHAMADLRTRFGRHVQSLSFSVLDRQGSGRLLSAGTTDIEAVSQLLSSAALTVIPSVLFMIGVGVVLVVLDAVLATVVLATALPTLAVATVMHRKGSSRAYRRVQETSAKVVGYISETLAGIRVVQAFGRELDRQRAFDALNDDQRAAKIFATRFSTGYGPFTLALGNVTLFVVLVLGGFRAVAGELTVGTIAAFVLYLRQFFNPLQDLTQFQDSLRSAGAGLERLASLFATAPGLPASARPASLPEPAGEGAAGEVRLDGVSFAYDQAPVLTGVDLCVLPGETLVVVGSTGAGKSTIAKLMARFYDPTEGRVLLDGQDLRDTLPVSVRRHVAILSQEPHLFRGTIADNIALGRPDAAGEEVVLAAEAVGIAPMIAALPQGYETEVDQAGVRLTAGQRQLVALARAWLVNPRVLILDEATSALDLLTERVALAALERLVEGRTAVVISHRLSAVDIADRVAVVEAGQVVELGTKEALLSEDTRFRRFHVQWLAAQSVG